MDTSTVENILAKVRQYKAASYCFTAGICYLIAGHPETLAATPLKSDKPAKLMPSNAKLEAEFDEVLKSCNSRTLLDRLKEDRAVSKDKFSSLQKSVALAGTDSCPGTVIPAGTSFTDTGDNTGANNTINTIQAGCSNYTAVNGPDHFYKFVLPAVGARIPTCSISLTSTGTDDLTIYTLSQGGGGCPFGTGNAVTNCVNGSDTVFGGGTETITDAEMDAMPAGIYYLAVDSFYPTTDVDSSGPYTMNFVCTTLAPTASYVVVGGKAVSADGSGLRNVQVKLTDSAGIAKTAITNAFGYYHFDDVEAGGTYVLQVSSKQYAFENPSRVITVNDQIADADFVASPVK